ncbi:MAG TPA: DMT family transporter [Acidimicrobiales bacterium]|nr:DMT family transporter [Acidimicrobiales bacterium]
MRQPFTPQAGRALPTALIGALVISCSAVLVQLSGQAPGTTAFFRCALAVPLLVPLAALERRRLGPPPHRLRPMLAGAFLGIDLVLWAHSIADVGAGVATVLGNLQVLFVAFIAWAYLRERPSRRFFASLPVVVCGVVLVGGLVGRAGGHPVAGVLFGLATSVAYSLFILLLRGSGGRHVAGPLADATIGAAAASLVLGLALGELDLAPPLGGLAWLALLALTSQTIGWLLITSSLPRLPAAVGSMLLLLQPASALIVADAVLGERPGLQQVFGAVLVCAGVAIAAGKKPAPAPG